MHIKSVHFSTDFNTVIPDILHYKLSQLTVPNFLTNRAQQVKLGVFPSSTSTLSIGAPQGYVLSPLLFSIYTNDCTSSDSTVKFLKFADDTTVIGLIRDGDESVYRQQVEQLSLWCKHNNLQLNISKTVEMVVDFKKSPSCLSPLIINSCIVSSTESYKFLGTAICSDLKWESIIRITKKTQQRMYFLCQLRKYNLSREIVCKFYRAMVLCCTGIGPVLIIHCFSIVLPLNGTGIGFRE